MRPILKDVSFKLEPGRWPRWWDRRGAGKTTIISLIPRFYDPDFGRSQDRWPWTSNGTRKNRCAQQISFVLQETLLFHGPVWYNIAYGKPDATRRGNHARGRAGQCA